MENATYGGVLAVPLIVGLVEVAKRLGLRSAWSAPLALGLGVGLRLAYLLTAGVLEPAAWVDGCVQGLALGLAASGLYSGARSSFQRAPRVSSWESRRESRHEGSRRGR